MTITVSYLKETPHAVQYRRDDGAAVWFPRSVLGEVSGMPMLAPAGQPRRLRVTVAAWFVKKNLRRNDVLCRCGHVTTYPPHFFAMTARILCEICARCLVTPVLRV